MKSNQSYEHKLVRRKVPPGSFSLQMKSGDRFIEVLFRKIIAYFKRLSIAKILYFIIINLFFK